MSKRVYLAGPISGLTYGDSIEWRIYAERFLNNYEGIESLSPQRAKKFLESLDKPLDTGYNAKELFTSEFEQALICDHGIMTRDYNDCVTSNLLLVNLLEAKEKSTGTIMEMAWAYHCRIPTVCIMEKRKDGKRHNIHDHGMLNEAMGFHVESLDAALQLVVTVLNAPLKRDVNLGSTLYGKPLDDNGYIKFASRSMP